MSATVLSLAAILALASDPHCGGAAPGSEFSQRLTAIALHESGGDPFVIGINADPTRNLPAATVRSATAEEAGTQARALIVAGRSIDLGLMQINSGQLAHHGLTIEAAFSACRSMEAGADHYADDVRYVWNLAHRRYNTGTIERGAAYAASIEQLLTRVRAEPLVRGPEDVVAPEPRRPFPGLEDVLHATAPVPDANDGLSDALHFNREAP
jgi:type IV secretion system protein VirB1